LGREENGLWVSDKKKEVELEKELEREEARVESAEAKCVRVVRVTIAGGRVAPNFMRARVGIPRGVGREEFFNVAATIAEYAERPSLAPSLVSAEA